MCMDDPSLRLPSFFPENPVFACAQSQHSSPNSLQLEAHVPQFWPLRCTQTSAGRSAALFTEKSHSVPPRIAFLLGARMCHGAPGWRHRLKPEGGQTEGAWAAGASPRPESMRTGESMGFPVTCSPAHSRLRRAWEAPPPPPQRAALRFLPTRSPLWALPTAGLQPARLRTRNTSAGPLGTSAKGRSPANADKAPLGPRWEQRRRGAPACLSEATCPPPARETARRGAGPGSTGTLHRGWGGGCGPHGAGMMSLSPPSHGVLLQTALPL